MSEMVERVARAQAAFQFRRGDIWDALPPDHHDVWRRRARASIEALREPTLDMIEAGFNASWYSSEDGMAWRLDRETINKIWHAMIAAAAPEDQS